MTDDATPGRGRRTASNGSPFTAHSPEERAAMREAVGVDDEAELFDIPADVAFDGEFGIDAGSEQSVRREIGGLLRQNDDPVEFLGRGHHAHYVPAVVDHLSTRSEFLTSYTQYQPEVTQGFLQALFEYQSMLVELTGLPVANCSMYDAATSLAEAALLADRVRETTGRTVLVPDLLRSERRAVLERYAEGPGLDVATYPMDDGNVDVDGLRGALSEDVVMVYAENPTVRGTIEERLSAVGDAAAAHDAMFCLGSDAVALALLEEPASVGADVVVGEAGALGLGMAGGTGHGLFAARETFLRQVPGRLVGAAEDASGTRSYTLTLQTREQHIRKERATSNICTNQAWLALRTAMHIAALGPAGLCSLAEDCVRLATDLKAAVDEIDGVAAPVHDRHHFREFVARTDRPATAVASDLSERGIAVHALSEAHLQIAVTEVTADHTDELVAALREVA